MMGESALACLDRDKLDRHGVPTLATAMDGALIAACEPA